VGPQSYERGYSDREFNLVNDKFTATYIDIKFYNTVSVDGFEQLYTRSDVVESSKWTVDSSNKTATLRVYLKETGVFYGYKAYYTDKNYLVISIKEMPPSLMGMVIELDPGHGGDDPGAISGNLRECFIAYDIAQELEKLLVAQGAKVIYSYDEKVTPVPEIVDRRLQAMADNPDMYIAIHLNSSTSSSTKGSSVYYYKNYSSDLSRYISLALPKAVKSGAGYTLENDGSHFYPFRVTRIENCPAVLVECGYISNSSERNMMNSAAGKKALARGMYDGILNYINAQ
jgi:N-acetylmuramoyl-L-alanine amidase